MPGPSMEAKLASFIAFLEESQTQKDVSIDALWRHLQAVEAIVAATPPPVLPPNTMQRLFSVLCSWLRAYEDFDNAACLASVLLTIARLLSQDSANESIAIQKGLLSSCTSLLRHPSGDSGLTRVSLEVLASLSVLEGSDKIISRLGTVQAILGLMKPSASDRPEVLEDAMMALALMAQRTRHRRMLAQSDGIKTIVDLISRSLGRSGLMLAICRFISNFAVKEECCLAILHCGGLEALTDSFDRAAETSRFSRVPQGQVPMVDVSAAIATAIWTCTADCPETQQALHKSGWLPSLVAMVQANPEHLGLHEAALGIVRGQSRSPSSRQDLLNLGVIPMSLWSMRRFGASSSVLKDACGIFGNLAADPTLRVQMGECGVVEVVVAALRSCQSNEDRKVAKLALGALLNLANADANRDVLARVSAGPVLLASARLFMRNENVLEYAIGAISHLAVHPVCNEQLVQAGAVEALLLFLGDHREDLHIISKSLVALRRVVKCSGGSVLEQVTTAGHRDSCKGLCIIIEAMTAHMYDETAVKECALLLTSLSVTPANLQPLMATAVQPCMKAMEVHQYNTPVADALAGFLAQMPLEEDDQWKNQDWSTPLGPRR